MLNSVSSLYRLNFSKTLKETYSKSEIKSLLSEYINGIDEEYKSIYDDIKRVESFIDITNIDINDIITRIKELPKTATELDLIDVIRYWSYYKKLKIQDIVWSLVYDIGDDDSVTVNNTTYVWNKRKNYFNEIQRGLSFYKAIDIVENADTDNIKVIDDNTYVFGFESDNIFLVVELSKLNVSRIKSFRRSDIIEYKKILGG